MKHTALTIELVASLRAGEFLSYAHSPSAEQLSSMYQCCLCLPCPIYQEIPSIALLFPFTWSKVNVIEQFIQCVCTLN